jgi:O-antigen ligase
MLGAFIASFAANIFNYPPIYLASALMFIVFFCKLIVIYYLGIHYGRLGLTNFSIMALYAGSVATVFAAIYQLFIEQSSLYAITGAPGLSGGHHSALGTFLVLPIALAISRLLNNRKGKFVDILILLLSIAGIFWAQSRSSIFSLFICIPILGIKYFFGQRKRWIILVGIFVALSTLGSLLGPAVYEKTFKAKGGIDLSSYSRLIIWQGALTSYENYPLYKKIFGSGISAYKINNTLPSMLDGSKSINGGHNQYVHALIETGLFGLMCFLYLWGSTFLYLYRRLYSNPELLGVWLTLTALIISGVVQENFWFNPWHGYTFYAFIFFLGLYIGEIKDEPK